MMQPADPQDAWEDDLLVELPETPALDGTEEAYTPEDDSDFGLPRTEREEVGLDAEAGIDEPLEADLELLSEEGKALLDDTAGVEDEDDDSEIAAGPEDGWTKDNEGPDDAAFDPDVADLGELGGGDAGEEGFDEEANSDLGLERLPPLVVDDVDEREDAADEGEIDLPFDAAGCSTARA